MNREQKIQQAFRLVEAIVGGWHASQGAPAGLIKDAWVRLFKNCYEGVDAMLEEADRLDPPKKSEPSIKTF